MSSFDVSVQAQIIVLLHHLQQKYHLDYLFMSHNLRVFKAFAYEVIVMCNGEIVEYGSADRIFLSQKFLHANLDGCCILVGI